MTTLGERLKSARKNAGYSQLEVFKLTGLNNKTLSHYENGSTLPDPEVLKKLVELYNVSSDYVLGLPEHTSFAAPHILSDFGMEEVIKDFNSLSDDAKMKAIEYIKMLKIVQEALQEVQTEKVEIDA